MKPILLELLTPSDEESPIDSATPAELAEKWNRRAAFLEAFALDCRERRDLTTALVLEAVAQAHRADARELQVRSVA